jgi:hypothetical protein
VPAYQERAIGLAREREPLVSGGIDRLGRVRLGEFAAEPLARRLPCVRPGNALRSVLVPGQLLELAKVGDGPARLEHVRDRKPDQQVW